MLEQGIYSILCKLFGFGWAIGCIYLLRRSLKQEWPEADPAAWKDKDDERRSEAQRAGRD